MKKGTLYAFVCCLFLSLCLSQAQAATSKKKQSLKATYERYCAHSTDIYEHIPVFRDLAMQCGSVVEIGLREMSSTWGFLQGLSESSAGTRSYLGIDLEDPPAQTLNLARKLALANGIGFQFLKANDMDIDIDVADMLFIDTVHTYCHLTYELEKFSPKIKKFIVMHDTSDPWGSIDDFQQYSGNYLEYPGEIDRTRRGLWAAVEDFLVRHPEWKLRERRLNCHGLTTLERVAN